MNSMRAVKQVQFKLDAKKAGHMGTLDPMGSGVLLVALGKATKLFDKHLKDKKTYRAVFQFGFQTDTLDCDGTITDTNNIVVTKEQLLTLCPKFVGEFDQVPPIYSAKKINGKNAYQLARSGKDIELKPKRITIFDFQLIDQLDIFVSNFLFKWYVYSKSLP
jgi:tRNA pseudouridine55 synthase